MLNANKKQTIVAHGALTSRHISPGNVVVDLVDNGKHWIRGYAIRYFNFPNHSWTITCERYSLTDRSDTQYLAVASNFVFPTDGNWGEARWVPEIEMLGTHRRAVEDWRATTQSQLFRSGCEKYLTIQPGLDALF